MSSLRAALSLCALLLCWSAAARAQERPHAGAMKLAAERLLRTGIELYEKGDYAEAAQQLEAAYEYDHHRTILFTWAQAERLSGHCGKAKKLYLLFIDSGPDEAQIAAAGKAIASCQEKDKVDAARTASRKRKVRRKHRATERTPQESTPGKDKPETSGIDVVGLSLTGLGVLGLATGGGFYLAARAAETSASRAESYQEYDDLAASAQSRRTISAIALATGGALVIAGAIRLITAGETRDADEMVVGMWRYEGTTGLVWSGAF